MKRAFCLLATSLLLTSVQAGGPPAFYLVKEKARLLSQQPYLPSTNSLPEALRDLTYVQYQAIAFKNDRALWKEERLPFQIEFLHRGWVHKDAITINEVDENGSHEIPFHA